MATATWYQATKAAKAPAPSKAQQMYNDPGFRYRSAMYNAALGQAQKNALAGVSGFQDPNAGQQPDPSQVQNAQQNNSLSQALQDLLNPDNAPVDLQTPGGNTLSGRGGKGKGAGSANLAKELNTKLQIMNLDEQKKLLDLQIQQDPQNYQLILQKLALQQTNAQNAYETGQRGLAAQSRGLNSSATASGAFTALGTQQARGDITAAGGDLSKQLQSRLQGIDISRQQQGLNEQYNQAALQSQSTMNFWERFAQAAQAGFFQNQPAAAPAASGLKYGTKNIYGYTYTPYGWIQGK